MGKPAARLGDTTMHGSPLLGACATTVLIGGKPAWRGTDQHTCPIPNAPPPVCDGAPHGPGITAPIPDGGSGVVLIQGKPAARVGDLVTEPHALVPLPPPNNIVVGEFTVLIGMVGGGGPTDPNVCQTEGHPVDVVSGRLIEEVMDIERLSPVPFILRRSYSSAMQPSGDLGPGWRHNYEFSLIRSGEGLELTDENGFTMPLPRPLIGETLRQGAIRVEAPQPDEYIIWRGPNDGLHFRARSSGRLLLVGIHDGPSLAVEIAHDASQRVSTMRDRCGRLFDFEFKRNRLTRVVERSSRLAWASRVCVEYAYDDKGFLTAVKDASGAAISYQYDHGLLVQETDRSGFSFYFQYDSKKRCTTTWGDGGLLYRRLDYDDQNNLTRVTDSRGATRFYYHSGGLVNRLVHGDGASKTFVYDDQSKLTSQLDETDIGWLSQHAEQGHEIMSVTPGGGATELVYDDVGRLIETRKADGRVKRWIYDDGGRLVQLVENDIVQCQWAYNAEGDVERLRGPLGYEVRYEYDNSHRVVSIVDNNGGEVHLSYDEYSNISEVREGDDLVVGCRYDDCNRLAERTEPDGRRRQYIWTGSGMLSAVRHPDGSESRFEYRWQMRTAIHQVGGSSTSTTRYDFDNEQNLVAIHLPDRGAFRFEWDLRNRLVARHEPSGRTVTYRHDPAGRIVEETCGPFRVAYEYDPAGNLAAVVGEGGDAVRYEYDAFGKLKSGACGGHENSFTYDTNGRLIREAADGESLEYRYDELGRRLAIRPSLGVDIGFTFSVSGALHAVSAGGQPMVEYRRDTRGRIVDSHFGNGLVEHRRWDVCNRNRSLAISRRNQYLSQRSFEYDSLSRLSIISDETRGEDRFHYSRLGAVDSQSLAGTEHAQTFRLDAEQNYLDLPGGRAATYGPGDRLLDDGQHTYEYDALGRTSARVDRHGERTVYHYDFRDLMTRIDHPDGRVTRYEYDAFGRRVVKVDGHRTTFYLWDGNQLLASWTDRGEVRQFVMDPFRWAPVAQLEVQRADEASSPMVEPRFCHTDYLGAITEMTSSNGDVVWSVQYDGMGKALQRQGEPGATPLRRPGQYFDEETGYYYNRYRYYDPSTARFTTPDPTDVQGGLNLYRYPGSTTTTLDLVGLSPTALVDNNFLVSLFNADRLGLQTTAEVQAAAGQKLGVSQTAYDEFVNGEGIGGRESSQRERMLKNFGIEIVKICGAREREAYEEAYNNYRRQGLSENDARIAAHAKAKGLPLLSGDQRAFVNNGAFANASTSSITNLGADSRGADVFRIILR